MRFGRLVLIAALAFACVGYFETAEARSTIYPMTVTDIAGRQVTIDRMPQRIALQDGRDALDLTLLDRSDPFAHIVVWNNLLDRFSPAFWSVLAQHWPTAKKIPDMGFDDNGALNLEEIIAQKPQLVIAELRARPVFEQDNVPQTLASLGIPLLYVDNSVDPVANVPRSVALLGRILNRTGEAEDYTDFYASHLAHLQAVIAKQPQPRPLVFVEALAGQSDAGNCCFTHGNFGWGLLVQSVGARNLGTALLPTPTGQIAMETLLAKQPDVLIMTGRSPGGAMPALDYNADPATVGRTLLTLESRPGFSALRAVRNGRVYGIYHPFYASVFDIAGLEYLAKFIYPNAFPTLDPAQTYTTLISQFTDIPQAPVLLGMQAPVQSH